MHGDDLFRYYFAGLWHRIVNKRVISVTNKTCVVLSPSFLDRIADARGWALAILWLAIMHCMPRMEIGVLFIPMSRCIFAFALF